MDTITILLRQLTGMWRGFVAAIPNIVIATVIILPTWLLARHAKRIADRLTGQTHLRSSLKQLVDTARRYGSAM